MIPGYIMRGGMDRDETVYTTPTGKQRSLEEYLSAGQILIGCEGNEDILSSLIFISAGGA